MPHLLAHDDDDVWMMIRSSSGAATTASSSAAECQNTTHHRLRLLRRTCAGTPELSTKTRVLSMGLLASTRSRSCSWMMVLPRTSSRRRGSAAAAPRGRAGAPDVSGNRQSEIRRRCSERHSRSAPGSRSSPAQGMLFRTSSLAPLAASTRIQRRRTCLSASLK